MILCACYCCAQNFGHNEKEYINCRGLLFLRCSILVEPVVWRHLIWIANLRGSSWSWSCYVCSVGAVLTLAEMITTPGKLAWTSGQNTCYSNDGAGKMIQMMSGLHN